LLIKPLKTLGFRGIEKHDFRNFKVCSTQVKDTKEYGKTLTAAHRRMVSYLSDYQMIFRNKTKVFFDKVQLYTQGILQSHRCNIEEISDTLLESNYFQMQQNKPANLCRRQN